MNEIDESGSTLVALSNDLATAVERAASSVVAVYGRQRMPATGIVWSETGLIVSANHVVERDEDIHIDTPDGRHLSTNVLGRDPNTDLVLLSIENANLLPATRATHPPKVGHLVLAIGRPGKTGPMASLGVISLIGDAGQQTRQQQLGRFLRTDAAMLPGFSGGPLIDAWGDVLGLNSSTMGRGSGFALPNETIERIVASLQKHGKVRRGFLGITAQPVNVNGQLAESLTIPNTRALVIVGLEADGPAEKQGLLIGDIIVRLAGSPVGSVDQLMALLTGELVGQPVEIDLIRGGMRIAQTIIASERA